MKSYAPVVSLTSLRLRRGIIHGRVPESEYVSNAICSARTEADTQWLTYLCVGETLICNGSNRFPARSGAR